MPTASQHLQAQFIPPMQCAPVASLPQDDEWTWELKLDGYRAQAVKNGKKVKLYSRNQNSLADRFPDIVAALGTLSGDFTLDGEVVALDAEGRPSFQLLQNAATGSVPLFFYVFDLLHRGNRRLTSAPIEKRRRGLAALLATAADPIRPVPLLSGTPAAILQAVRRLRLEGVVGKRRGSLYEPGKRSGSWTKLRTNQGQEFVIGGYLPGTRGFDSLLIGYYEGRALHYAGKVRNGFTPRLRDQIFPRLRAVPRSDVCPFANLPETGRQRWGQALTADRMAECRWLRPQLVCNVEFVEFTSAGKLRHPVFIALRDDKPATSVKREHLK